jgi:regulator of protease activity HflC (stomatin/prohibitin superfamily)
MLFLKYLLLLSGAGMLACAATIVIYDLRRMQLGQPVPVRWREAGRLTAWAWLPLLLGLTIVVVPSGKAGVCVSQVSGTLPGTLYPGTHFVIPLIQRAILYDTRDQLFTTSAAEDPKKKPEPLKVQSREGLPVGLAVTVRYRVDPRRLDYVHSNLPQPLEEEIVPPVVASVFRQLVPNYMVRDIFSAKREEVRRLAYDAIARKLAADAILVKEVMLRDIVLPPEYAKSLEGLLLKEQENDRLNVDLEVKAKQVHAAELEAEAEKARRVKAAEAEAQVVVLQAKAQADAMQYMLPLKEKQIQQTRLEAEARKESTVKNAEAAARAKVIDSEAEQSRIRLLASANAERMGSEAQALKQNPLLIQKIIAERLSDKVQIMMVPSDGKFFFANDVLRAAGTQ